MSLRCFSQSSEVTSLCCVDLLVLSQSRCAPIIPPCVSWAVRRFKVHDCVCCHFLLAHTASLWLSCKQVGMWLRMCSSLLEEAFNDPWVLTNSGTFALFWVQLVNNSTKNTRESLGSKGWFLKGHISTLLHTISITTKDTGDGNIWHIHGHFLDSIILSGCLHV